jgi:long-chain fatty acid transport protein
MRYWLRVEKTTTPVKWRNRMKLLRQLGVGIVALTAAFLAVPEQGHALNGQNDIGYGVKSKGMGGVGIALPHDSLAAASNPAGMVYVADRWDIGLGYVFQDASATFLPIEGATSTYTSKQGIWLPELGVAYMFCPCQVVGVSIFVNGAISTRYNAPVFDWAGVVAPRNLSLEYYQLAIAPSWSWRINSVNSVGVAVNLYAVSFKLNGAGALTSNSSFPDDLTDRGKDYDAGISFRLGWLGNICDKVMVGFSFQTKTWIGKIKDYQGFLPDSGNVDLPGNIGVGITWNALPCLILSGEWVQLLWTGTDFFGNSSLIGVTRPFGSTDGPGLSWNQQSVFKVGAAYKVMRCLTLRVGYNFGQNPIGPTDTFMNVPTAATIEHHVTTGATYSFGCSEVSFYYWYGFANTVRGQSPDGVRANVYDLRNRQQSVGVAYGCAF